MGLLLGVVVHPAGVQDRDGAEPLLRQARRLFPFIERIIGDAGYQGPKMAAAVRRCGTWRMEIVRRCDRHRFVVLPKRRIVERTLAWVSRNRRLARDFERHSRIAAAFVRIAMIRIMLRRLAATHSR
jgi:transposase